jgi:hypothetical protein
MKIKLDIDDGCTDAITIATLKRTLSVHGKKPGPDPDSAEIASAIRLLLKYYGPYQ